MSTLECNELHFSRQFSLDSIEINPQLKWTMKNIRLGFQMDVRVLTESWIVYGRGKNEGKTCTWTMLEWTEVKYTYGRADRIGPTIMVLFIYLLDH